jgi:Uma2 family endonuclease
MAALAEFVGHEAHTFILEGLPMPLTLRLPFVMTDHELEAFSRRNKPFRIERNSKGELEIMSPVGARGGNFEARVSAKLSFWAEEHGGIAFSPSVGFTLPDGSVRSPDASWLSEGAWESLTEEQKNSFAPRCPEFLIELLSPSDSRRELEAKMEMWITNGAQLAWMIDPFAATVTIYRPGEPSRQLDRPDWVEAETVVPGFRLETSRLWAK